MYREALRVRWNRWKWSRTYCHTRSTSCTAAVTTNSLGGTHFSLCQLLPLGAHPNLIAVGASNDVGRGIPYSASSIHTDCSAGILAPWMRSRVPAAGEGNIL